MMHRADCRGRSTARPFPGTLKLGLMAILLASLGACVVVPARHNAPVPSGPAPVYSPPPPVYSPAPTVVIVPAPPPLRVEQRSAAPAAHWFWVDGHWRWDGQRHHWEPGHWVESRRGEHHAAARLVNEGGVWVYHPARWQRGETVLVAPPVAVVAVTQIRQPPPRLREAVPPRPGPGYFWIDGHWRWEGGNHVWVTGHWEPERRGERWTAAQWKLEPGGRWAFVDGYWSRR